MIIVALLADIPFFADLETNQLKELLEIGRELELKQGEMVFSQGDAPDGLYVLISGQVRVFGTSDEGTVVEYATFEDNQFFGELALLDGKPRSASVSCLKDCDFFVIPRAEFLDLLRSSTVMLSSVLSGLSEKIRGSNEKYFWERLKQERIKTEMEMERSRSLAQMVAGIAHEINTPLGIVRTAASLFPELLTESFKANYSDDEDLVDLFEDLEEASSLIQGNITRANKLVQSFKTLSVRQATDNWETVSLPTFLDELLLLYGAQTRGAAIDIRVEYDAAEKDWDWDGYPGFLTQVLMNLLSNAERYAFEKGASGTVVIKLERGHSSFVLTVSDNGAGIPEEDQTKIFEPFFTTGRKEGGTGLGLSISWNLVTEALKGTLSVESKLGEGSTFRIEIPHHVPKLSD